MGTSDPGMANPSCPLHPPVSRKGFVEFLLGGGLLATFASFTDT